MTRSPPGGPNTDTFSVDIIPTRSGSWWVSAESIAGSAIIVKVYSVSGGIPTLESSSKLKYAGDESTHTPMLKGFSYAASFTPYGTKGTSILHERFTTPSPPAANFTFSPSAPTTVDLVTFDASSSSDPDDDIVSYGWDFGDGGAATGVVATHQFAAERDYTVTLAVTDGTGLVGKNSTIVSIRGNKAPVAIFAATRDLMKVNVDASAAIDPDGIIADYHWVWGDGSAESTGTSALAMHTYSIPGKYTILLHVTDDLGAVSEASADVSVNTWTVDSSYHDFFNVPFGEWWDMRTFYVNDRPIRAECFSAEGMVSPDGIAPPWCIPLDPSIPDIATYPYTYWSPSPVGDAMIYAPYLFDVNVKNAPAFTIDKPVILPSCADLEAALAPLGVTIACPTPAPSGGSVAVDESFQYLTTAAAKTLLGRGCPDLVLGNDGFMTQVRLTLTMDSSAAARLFGVTSGDQWGSLIKPGCGPGDASDTNSGVLEQGIKAWLEAQGNGPYDVYNSFGNEFRVFAIEAMGSYDAASGRHTLTVDFVSWGFEVLTARWFYWGATLYKDGVSAGAAPAGWWGMEAAWFEGLRMTGTIAESFSAAISGATQYHFRQLADAGADGIFTKLDDVPKWTWAPILGDRLYGSAFAPVSELNAYAGYAYVHTTAGSSRYGAAYDYDYVPAVWQLRIGETQTFAFPTGTVVLYDPYWSPPLDDPLTLAALYSAIAFAYSVPATGVGSYNAATAVLTVIGPTSIGTPPTTAGGKPLESRPIYNLLKA